MQLEIKRRNTIQIGASKDRDISIVSSAGGSIRGIISQTTQYWEEHPTYVPAKNELIVYMDYRTEGGVDIPAVKIGDGNAYVVDLPFIAQPSPAELQQLINDFSDHVRDMERHTASEEKDAWNNKVSCRLAEDERLIFTTI